jgi:hypothetical protein
MRAPSAGELLDVWETGFSQSLTGRALDLLAAACPETSRDALAALSIGSRDAGLLRLREALWGPRMDAEVACRNCRERLELILDSGEMLSRSKRAPADEITWSADGFTITFRVPASVDLLAAMEQMDQDDPEDFSALIFQRCLLSAQYGDEPADPEQLPAEVAAGVAGRMAETDPLADIRLDLTCPSCEHRWSAVFDIVSFLWTEIEVWAWRMLSDVHTLARAYGWRERDILALSPTRRQFYLEMVGA